MKKLIFLFIVFSLLTSTALAEDSIIKIGVLAQRGPERCMEKWSLTAEYLSNKISENTFIIVPFDYNQIHSAIDESEVDFILANSLFYVELESLYKINRIATLKNEINNKIQTKYGGVVFCKRQRQDIRHLVDLKGKTFMAVNENAFGGWRMAYRELKDTGIDPLKDFASLNFGGTHDAVVRAVQNNKVDAGTVRTDTLERMHKDGMINIDNFYIINEHGGKNKHLPFLHSTRIYPEWPVAKLKHTSNEVAEKVATALISMPKDCAAAQAARCAGWTIPSNYQSVHDCLKELKLGPYKNLGKITIIDVIRKYLLLISINFLVLITLAWFLFTHIKLNQEIKTTNKKLKIEVDEKLQIKEALQKSERKHRLFFENAPIGIMHYSNKGIITDVNKASVDIFGSSREKIIGLDINDELDENFKKGFYKSLSGEFGYYDNEYTSYTGDKKSNIKLIWIPIKRNDEIVAGVGIIEDITKQKQTDDALRESEKKHRLLADNTIDCIWQMNLDSEFTYVNKSIFPLLGYTPEEWIGSKLPEHCTTDEMKKIQSIITNVIDSPPDRTAGLFETNLIHKNGKAIPVEINERLIFDDTKNLIGFQGTTRNITERRQAEKERHKLEAQLKKAQKIESIGTLAGGIAHDFNNILFPVLGYLEMILNETPEDTPLHDQLKKVYNGANRAKELVKQILAFSRQSTHELKPLNVYIVIKEALKLLRSSIPSTIEINQNINQECGLVMADPTNIHQIIMNLCTNAFHAMEITGGKLTVILKEIDLTTDELKDPTMTPGPYVCLIVADTGHGMEQYIIDRIFDPYFTTKEARRGTGLGLAVVHGIVKDYNGHINVYSEPGKGTEFKIYLPVVHTEKTISKIKPDLPIPKGNEKILLIDDQDDVIQIERQMLEKLGYQVVVRTSSPDALELFRAKPDDFDIVITDMTMPDMTGDKLAGELIKIRPDIPVILCTGFSETMSEEKAASLGIKSLLLKPVTMIEFSHKIRKVLDKKREDS